MRQEEANAMANVTSDDACVQLQIDQLQQQAAAAEEEVSDMLRLTFRSLETQSTVQLHFDGLRCQLCMDFLFALIGFLPTEPAADATADATTKDTTEEGEAIANEKALKVIDAESDDEPTVVAAPSESSMMVFVSLTDACITVYAEPKSATSRALRLALGTRWGGEEGLLLSAPRTPLCQY